MRVQAWFERAEISCRKFSSSAWILLRMVPVVCEEGELGNPEFKKEFLTRFGS